MTLSQLGSGAAAPSGAAVAGVTPPSGTARPDTARPDTALPAPIAALVELGVLDDLAAGRAQAEDISRAHPVWRVRLADPHDHDPHHHRDDQDRRLIVKAGIGHGGPDLAVECLVYRMTWWCPPLAAALPRPLVVDEDRQLLVLTDVGDDAGSGSLAQRAGWSSLLTGVETATPSVIAATTFRDLGRTVGALHRATAGYPLPPAPPPLVLSIVGRTADEIQAARLSAQVTATVARLAGQHRILTAVEELRRPVAGCLVNHDLKWDNVVLDERVGGVDPVPVLLDWELAGLGDPAWDLGCLLAEHLLRAPTVTLDDSSRALLGGYRDGARPRPEVGPLLARRVVLAAGLRVAQLALEVAWTPYSGDAGAIDRLTDRALLVLDAATLIEEVRVCLS